MLRQNARRRPIAWTLMCGLLTTATTTGAQGAGEAVAQARGATNVRQNVKDIIDEISEADTSLEISVRRSKLIRTKLDIARIAVSDSTIVDVVAFGTKEFELIGKQTGTTSLRIWLGDEQQPRRLGLLVTVVKGTGVDDRRRLECGELQSLVNELFPNSKLQLIPVADKLIVKGQARDPEEATRIIGLIRKAGSLDGLSGATGIRQGTASDVNPNGGRLPTSGVINMLEVPSEQPDIEGRPDRHLRSPIWSTHRDSLKHPQHQVPPCYQADAAFVHGPHGFSE